MPSTRLDLVLPPASLKDNTADFDRLAKPVRKKTGQWPQAPLGRIMDFARAVRRSDGKVTAYLTQGPEGPVLAFVSPSGRGEEPEEAALTTAAEGIPGRDWPRNGLGLALDIGSTHLQASLLDLATGKELAAGTRLNPQAKIGADILTRIHAAAGRDVKGPMHRMLVEAAAGLAGDMCRRAGRTPSEISRLVAAGNTTMTHFFLGLDVQSICREPYIPVINRPGPFFTAELGLDWAPKAVGFCLPNVGSYFGGDLLAGIAASGLHEREEVAILVDVGTNAEVVLGNRDWLVACAGAAGPALESGVAKMGILAQPGAVEKVSLDPKTKEPSLGIIPDAAGETPRPKGLCGSGLLQLLAQLYLTGVINMRGKIVLEDHPRVVQTDEGLGYVVVFGDKSGDGTDIVITEVEIDILLRSKAAMYTILRTVTMEVGVDFEDLSTFFVAGAFGNVIDPDTAITLGMLPDLPRERFKPLGNSSLLGCRMILLDPGRRKTVEEVVDRLTYLELNVNQALMNRFSAARFIPHTDTSRFPSVPARH